jgi:hypothetical protein
MAKDVTVRINGQNPDGTFNVTMPDAGNPFMGGGTQTGAMVPYNPSANQPVQAGGYRARVGNVDVMFSSEADFLKADKAWREQMQDQGAPIVGGGGGSRGTGSWIRTGAEAAAAVGAFLQGRNIRRKLEDLEDALHDQKAAADDLAGLANNTKYAELIPVLLKAFKAERYATETSITLLEDQLTAVDIQTGAGVAKVAGELWEGSGGASAGRSDTGVGTILGVGAAGLGLGLLFANSRDDRRSRRR